MNLREHLNKFFRKYILGPFVWLIYKSVQITWRVTLIEPPEMLAAVKNKNPFIIAHWHGDEIAVIWTIRRYRVAAITSTSSDGEMMNTVIRLLGAATSRGSSTRGGVSALKGLLRLVKQGYNGSFAVDGPKGPYHKIKPGIFELSRLLKAPIYYSGVSCDRAWYFPKAWNKAFFPKPFSKVYLEWHGPFGPVSDTDDPRSEDLAKTLEDAMHKAQGIARKKIAPLDIRM